MEYFISDNIAKINCLIGTEIKKLISEKPNAVLGFATGSTPLGAYKELINLYKKSEIDFSEVITFNLDEYVGLEQTDPNSYRYFMDYNLFNHINIPKKNTHVPNGCAADLQHECIEYENMIKKAGGVDLQILGIGHNGHIGFNEPGTPFNSITHVVDLDERTRKANSRFFSTVDEVPGRAISMGIKTIMMSRKIILIVFGEDKADIIKEALTGKITEQVPASVLQLHPNVSVYMDDKAASKL